MRLKYAFLTWLLVGSLQAVSIGQIDTFADGTAMGWLVPGASPFSPRMLPRAVLRVLATHFSA